MADLARLTVRLEAESSKLRSELTKANEKLDRFGKKTKSVTTAAKKAFAGLAAAIGAAALGRQIFNISVNFEKLRASLETVTGSTAAANKAFDRVREFAATTPFAVTEVTSAFIKLKALGLDPSERALKSYGNTASAMAKTLNQMIEAVADAATGEFERLKEFGIKAKSQGDKVSFIFRGVTKTVKKEAKEIEGYLLSLGEAEFAGGMERQSKTIGGALSNMGDAWDTMLYKFAETGPIQAATAAIRGLTKALESLTAIDVPIELNLAGLKLDRKRIEDAIAFGIDAKGTLLSGRSEKALSGLREELAKINEEIKRLESSQVEQVKLQFQEMQEAFETGLEPAARKMVKNILAIEDAAAHTKWMKDAQRDLNEELKRENDLMQEGAQLKEALLTPTEAYNAELERLDFLLEKNAISFETYNRAMLDVQLRMEEIKEKTEEINVAWQDLGFTFASAFEDAIVEGKKFSDVLKGLAQDILRIMSRRLLTEPLARSASGFFGELFSVGSLSGAGANMGAQSVAATYAGAFADGGEFTVGGSGGVDSQLVALRATPGESVTVTAPGRGGAGDGMVFNYSIDARGAQDPAGVEMRLRRVMSETTQMTISAIRDLKSRGELPEFA